MKQILFTAGGTGGHMIPAQAVAKELMSKDYTVHFVTDIRGSKYLDSDISQLVYNLSALGNRTLFRLPIACFQMLFLLWSMFIYFIRNRPEKVVGFGGYVSFPALLMARIFKVPYFIHEQNAVMGKVNRWFATSAHQVMTSFSETKYATRTVSCLGLPVRPELESIDSYPNTFDTLNLLVLGGSQGTSCFSTLLPKTFALLERHERKKFFITQQCRQEDIETVKQQYALLGMNCDLASFFQQMDKQYEKAHLIISRSGASTVMEAIITARPAIFVPLPGSMDDHQAANANFPTSQFASWTIQQNQLAPEKLCMMLKDFLKTHSVLVNASCAMQSIAKKGATAKIAEALCG